MIRCTPQFLPVCLATVLAGWCIAHGRAQTVVVAGIYNGSTISGDISVAAGTSATFRGGTGFTGTHATFGSK